MSRTWVRSQVPTFPQYYFSVDFPIQVPYWSPRCTLKTKPFTKSGWSDQRPRSKAHGSPGQRSSTMPGKVKRIMLLGQNCLGCTPLVCFLFNSFLFFSFLCFWLILFKCFNLIFSKYKNTKKIRKKRKIINILF